MATVKTVSVKYGRKINLGDFNSANVEIAIWADLTEEEAANLDAEMRQLWDMAKTNVKAQVLPLVKDANPLNTKTEDLFLGIPAEAITPNRGE